ncbi:putative serine/threonine-protein kinase [Eucalyptus grandis]|uniref:putative serine/threonine-protein kinase n=1 Tax=Eucalyptus grandis TaxID=71139 RepID=UPI00192EFC57|nr:putative serine/threonine-protein kinase [Eucalyptus grandis]
MKLQAFFPSCFSASNVVDDGSMDGVDGLTPPSFRAFTYKEMKAATKGFHPSNKIGEGSFGSVFKGRLQDGTTVAIKVLSVELESMRGEREFISEITALSHIKHENLIGLLGCCIEGADRFLVYENMENNSIAHAMIGEDQKRMRFNWEVRRKIMLGIACGLAYLHEEVEPHIVHRDVKASNILLDRDFTPKVSDFGLCRVLRGNITHISTRVAGTLGYLAPEYAISGHLTRKSDVYSFGVLLLEIISGRPVVAFNLELGEQHLVQKVWEAHKEDELQKIVDPVLSVNDYPAQEAVRFIKVGLLCVQEAAKTRPRMSMAVKMLTGKVNIDGVEITEPGHIADLTDIHISSNKSSMLSVFSKDSDSSGTARTPKAAVF